ncbi:hypothetical protein [Actinacidiphila soli]|jgi:hypothetical protein|uniref:hypothetical protein n=1 Tax=Actinacidiphila soli TaxID=2487275 RepID=UPI000FC9B220|nr:hypothetical protein [Actinacidiphila soli]
MTIDDKLLKMPYAVAARKRAEAGGTIFSWRALVPTEEKHELTALSDAIEAVEHYGWRLDQALPAGQDSPLQAAWFLIFRRAQG